jgi:hypothetical protein
MISFEVVTEKVAEVIKLALGFVAQAASILLGKAEKLSLDEISCRLGVFNSKTQHPTFK